MGKIRGTHMSPGVYSEIKDMSYAVKTLGITTLGLVGETVKGPAFEPVLISDFSQFETIFGETSAERFKDSLYPKYELPYIAKSYLQASDQLYVCRVLGLSGYNAGPAFLLTGENEDGSKKYLIAVLRARGTYQKYTNIGDECNPISKYDQLVFNCDEISIEPYVNASVVVNCGTVDASGTTQDFAVNALNFGQMTIVTKKAGIETGRYAISLNAGSKDYIYNVLGSKATEGSATIFVEELYDLNLKELIESQEVVKISSEVTVVPEIVINAVADPVRDFVTVPSNGLTKKMRGQTFICAEEGVLGTGDTYNGFGYHEYVNGSVKDDELPMKIGYIYQVMQYNNPATGLKSYCYIPVLDTNGDEVFVSTIESTSSPVQSKVNAVNVLAYDTFVALHQETIETGETVEVVQKLVALNNMSDYHEQFRCASTPWFVSEIKGDAKHLEVKKLFRFHTITDGTDANTQVKVSIANVSPDDGTFDVLVRDFADSDGNPTVLESYKGLNMIPGSSKYIGLQIGTLDGAYELKSNYIMVEVIENDMTKNCVPCGFLGYPVRNYEAYGVEQPTLTYNRFYDEDIKVKKQYFGMSDLTGIDEDLLYYKGKSAYTEEYTKGYTHAFHLDSTLSSEIRNQLDLQITIDGEPETVDVVWDAVSPNNVTIEGLNPIIGSEQEMEGTIYEDIKLRKFTACFYGGFDGWDVYRNSRTNTDEFKANKYKGTITNGFGQTFSRIQDGTYLALDGNCITSDYYAYLAGVNQFEQPERYRINLFATPGIDYVNNTLLVNDVLDMVEEKRQDTLYIVTTPDKPWGAGDAIDEMYSSEDAVDNLDDTGIDTYSMCTYYPWIKYYDVDNNTYINLPPTKDVLRNMADTDNKSFPWIAPAGISRGVVECTKMHFFAKLEDEDTLYDGRINPLKSFSQDGVRIWGNKTVYSADTPMNRINVVRLMLYMKRVISEAVRQLIFEPNDKTLVNQFESIVNPILNQIKTNRGISDFRLTTSQTDEQIDAHELSAQIFIKPVQSLEYIELSFTVTPQSVSFDSLQ